VKTPDGTKRRSFLSMDGDLTPINSPAPSQNEDKANVFFSTGELLKFVTLNWREHFVTSDLNTKETIEPFVRRPFFMLVNVVSPILQRYRRSLQCVTATKVLLL
jgi:dCMP deaminase